MYFKLENLSSVIDYLISRTIYKLVVQVVQPNIPAIDFNTFELIDDVDDTPSAHAFMGGFSWDMVFR